MTERLKFVQDALSDRLPMAEACARHGVSRPTGYKWISAMPRRGGVVAGIAVSISGRI